jgi:aminoglycoside phosphotransferase family enzyme
MVCQAILKSFVADGEIIHEHLHDLLDQIKEYHHRAPLKKCWSIT